MPGPESYNFPILQGKATDVSIETPRSQVIGETSRYDPNYYIPIGGLTAEEIQATRAENQGFLMELGTAAANLIPNTALSVVESAAHLADIEDWSNMIQGNKANYGNVLTEWASQNKNYFGEVYRKSSDAGFDITDSAWWVSNGAGLVESVAAFGLTGYGVGSVLGKGASSLSKALNAYGKAKMGIELSAQLGTSGVLAFTEGTMTGAQVFKDVYPEVYNTNYNTKLEEILQQGAEQYGEDNLTEEYYKYADTAAKQFAEQIAKEVAGESATKAVRINMANTFLNLPETGALFRSMSANRYLDDALRITKGEKFDDYVARIKSFDTAKHITREGIKSKIQQTGGEALEEMVNIYAEQEGKNVSRKAMDKDIVSLGEMLADDDIWAAGFWGAIGGSMQSFVMNKMPKWVTQEDGTTKRTTIGEYNKQQVTNKYEEQLGDLKDRLTEFVTAKDNLVKASQTNDEKLYNESINTIFKYNSFNSIVKGVEEQLIDDYSRIMTLSPEEAAQQGFKGDYKQDAANKIQSIRENTAEWNKIQDRYMSQDLDLAGYPETIFQQFINVENNKKIIAEQEFEINKLQSDINQSYALKGTDLTIAAYNDIVSSIRALDNDFELETIDLENLLNLQGFDKNTQKRIVAKLNNKYGNLENAKTQIEKNLDNIREKANDLARTFKLQRENFDIQVDPENKLSQEEKDRMFAQILSENEFEIDALTEAKSQLQRNRETLRAQEEELRNLKSKDGVNKFKELKRQKLTEQNERVEQEVVEEQEQQAEAERQAQQEVVDDIRRRQEEEPETVTEEEVITLQQLEELEEQEGETYQEGEYTSPKPEELNKEYEDISDSANKSDEDGKIEDQQGNLIFIDDKLIYSFDKIAYASTVEYSEDKTTGVIKHTSLELNPETNPDLLTTKFVAGTPIKIKKLEAAEFKPFSAPREITFKDELGREVLVANKGELVTFEMLYHPYMQPIGIYDDSNNLIGMLHDVTYVRPERVLQQSLEEDRNNLIALRSKIGNDFIETTIVGKTNGHINQFRDGFRKLSELMPGPIEFAIATSSIQLNTSKTTIVDDLINKPKYKVGQVYAITYTPNGQKIAIPVKTTQVKEHPEVLNELLAAFDAFAEGKISQNQLKEVFSKYIYSTPTSEKLDAAGKNFKREVDNKDRMYIDYDSLNVDGIVFGKSGDTKRFLSSRTPKEDIEKLRKIFISILSESYININFEKVKNESFVKNFTTSNVRFYKLPDGRVTVFDNPVISISTSFAPGIKPIEKTEEQPRVEPDPISDEVYNDFIDNNIISEDILNDIANKIINKINLSPRETSIFSGKTSEINEIIRQQAASSPVVTPTESLSNIESTTKAFQDIKKQTGKSAAFDLLNTQDYSVKYDTSKPVEQIMAEAYHKAKAGDKSWSLLSEAYTNNEALIKAVEAVLNPVRVTPQPATTVQATPVSTDTKSNVKGSLVAQGTSIELEIVGETGKEFLLTVDRKGNINLFSEKQSDGSYKSGEPAPKEAVDKLYNKYVPEKTRTAITNWLNALTGSWAAPETEDGKNYDKAEKALNVELATLESKPTDAKADIEKERQEKYNTQYNNLVSGNVLDNEGNPVYEEDKGIGANGLSTLTEKTYGHGHIRTSGLNSLKVLEDLLEGSEFSGMFGQIGQGAYSTWESGKFIIVSNNINPTKNNKLNLNEVEIILNAGLSPFAQELANKYPNVIFKDFNGKKYNAELAAVEGKQQTTDVITNDVESKTTILKDNELEKEKERLAKIFEKLEYNIPNSSGKIRLNKDGSFKEYGNYENGVWEKITDDINVGSIRTDYDKVKKLYDNDVKLNELINSKLANDLVLLKEKLGGLKQLKKALEVFAYEQIGSTVNLDLGIELFLKQGLQFDKLEGISKAVEQLLIPIEPTIQPEETKTRFTSNNGLEFDIDFEDDADLLPMFTEVKSGVQELFDSNPELASIGTLEQYSQYLDSVFPDSKVKDIVYHGAMEQLLPKDGKFKGYVTYFSTTKKYSETFGFPINRKVIQAVVNIANPYNAPSELADVPEEIHNTDEFTNPRIIKSKKLGYDSVIGVDAGQKEGGTIAIFEPEQIHILGTKQDIEGFNQFVQSGKQIEKSLSLQDKVNNLIQEGKITKFCK